MLNVVTKYDLYARAQHALSEGDASTAEDCLLRARRLAIALAHNEPSEDQAEAALKLARLYRACGYTARSMELFDESFSMYARVLGESHKTTLEVQREYGMLLTLQHMQAQRQPVLN